MSEPLDSRGQSLEVANLQMKFENMFQEKEVMLTDLPMNILRAIIEFLDFKTLMRLRKVNRGLQNLVDTSNSSTVTILLNASIFPFFVHGEGYQLSHAYESEPKKNLKNADDTVHLSLSDFKIAIKCPKLRIECLQVEVDIDNEGSNRSEESFFDNIQQILSNSQHKLIMKYLILKIRNQEEILSVLPFLNPKKLEEIQLSINNPVSFHLVKIQNRTDKDDSKIPFLNLSEVVHLEQWNAVKRMTIDRFLACLKDENKKKEVEHISHFDHFFGMIKSVDPEDLLYLKEKFHSSPTFERCSLFVSHPIGLESISSLFGASKSNCFSYPIANPEHFLEIQITSNKFYALNTNFPACCTRRNYY